MLEKPIILRKIDNKNKLDFDKIILDDIVTLAYQYLQPNGWFNKFPVDEEGYTPWYTLPAIGFLKDILCAEHKILEYGSGYSSLFFYGKVAELLSVEHEYEWAKKIADLQPGLQIHVVEANSPAHIASKEKILEFFNTQTFWRSNHKQHDVKHGLVDDEFTGYASMIYMKPKGHYDIVVVDGMARALCAYLAIDMIAEDGIIILDNSDRCQYNSIHKNLIEKGFGRIDFWGIGNGQYEQFCTSFFSRRFNFLKNNKLLRPDKPGPITT